MSDDLDQQDLLGLADDVRLHLCEALVVLAGRDGTTEHSRKEQRRVVRREILDALNSINCINYNIETSRRMAQEPTT